MNYTHLLAADMDYTLLMPGKPVSDTNIEAIRKLEEAGVAFTLATGRTSYLTGKYARALGIKVPIITSNGGALYDYALHKDIYSNDMDTETLVRLKVLFDSYPGTDITGYSTEGIFCVRDSSRRDFINNYNSDEPDTDKAPIHDLTDFLEGDVLPAFNKFLLVSPSPALLREICAIPDLEVVSSAKDFYDVMRAGSTKGSALMRLAETLGIPAENTFAIGDSENDISMIEAAGCGIAMSNSSYDVIEAADATTGSCEEDGFAQAVHEIVLPKLRG